MIVLAAVAFLASLLLTRLWITGQEHQKLGQPIRDYGPEIHAHKQSTPTAGGITLLLTFLLSWALLAMNGKMLFVGAATLLFGLIGLLDDGLKFFQQHSQGLPARYKLLLQFIVCGLLTTLPVALLPPLRIPFVGGAVTLSPAVTVGLIFLVLISTVNAFNETDGLDGLLGGVTLIALGTYGFILWSQGELTLLAAVVLALATLLGFLWWNVHPARIFLGDTGSFALGGLIGALALVTGTALLLPLIAIIPVVESLSVILQVASFKLLKKRVFKVSPLHHHFERAQGVNYEFFLPNQEWPEALITLRFWIISALGALLGLIAYR